MGYMVAKRSEEEYVQALESELMASLEREKNLLNEDLNMKTFLVKKVKNSKLYKNVISNPDSKAGTVVRAPRSIYRLIKNPEVRKSLMQKKTISDYLGPWNIKLEERKNVAKKSIKEGKKLALYFVEKPDSSTFRYRCYNTYQATLKSEKWQAVYFFKNEVGVVEELLPKASLLVFGRQSGQEKIVSRLVDLAHKNGIKAGLDIDDLVFDLKNLDLFLDSIGEKINRSYWLSYFASVQTMSKMMDFFITTNDFLVEKIQESYDRPCRVIRNSLNNEQVAASLAYLKLKTPQGKNFKIGYFSGSPTHAKDFAVAEPGIVKFLNKHEEATLTVVGFMRFSENTEKMVENGRIKFLPITDFRKLQRLMAEVDVNIAPLLINDFTNCKSELKFFEAAAVETTTIASPTYTFKKAISDGKNGFLAKPGEWYDKLEYLYENPSENAKIAKAARKYALENYYGEKFLKEVEKAYDAFVI